MNIVRTLTAYIAGIDIYPAEAIVLLWPSVAFRHPDFRNKVRMLCVATTEFADLVPFQGSEFDAFSSCVVR